MIRSAKCFVFSNNTLLVFIQLTFYNLWIKIKQLTIYNSIVC